MNKHKRPPESAFKRAIKVLSIEISSNAVGVIIISANQPAAILVKSSDKIVGLTGNKYRTHLLYHQKEEVAIFLRDRSQLNRILIKLVIDELIMDTYKKKAWGSKEQRYNEHRKFRYHFS